MEDLTQYLPKLLVGAGVIMQFAMRRFKGVSDVWYHVLAVVLCVGAYLLTTEMTLSWRIEVLRLLSWLPDHLPTVWGGTFAMSNLAKAGSTTLPEPMAKLMPVTDSN